MTYLPKRPIDTSPSQYIQYWNHSLHKNVPQKNLIIIQRKLQILLYQTKKKKKKKKKIVYHHHHHHHHFHLHVIILI